VNQIVLIALRRPYTFVVLAILIVLFGTKSLLHTPTDVFPNIRIPVISVVWSYAGLLPIDVQINGMEMYANYVEAGKARIRPVLMTASAMIIGMLPMSMGNSPNAPLGRAVIGGLLVATLFTLFFVPCVYTIFYTRRTARQKVNANG
jgi:multidrug efflux pump subunit AcrB